MTDDRRQNDMTMNCDDVLELLPIRIARSGELGVGVTDALDRHLAGCAECAAESRFLARLVGIRPEPPADLVRGVLARIEEHPDVIPLRRAVRRRPLLPWASRAAAAVLVLAIGYGIFERGIVPFGSSPGLMTAADAPTESDWLDDWYIAGAPNLDGISDETLAVLAAGIFP